MTHSREHDVLLAALLAGDVLESDPRAREQLSRCPACAQTWKEARIEMDSLKSAARRAQRAQEAAERGGPVPGEERAMEFLRAELARRMPGTAPGDRIPEQVHGRAQPRPVDGRAPADGAQRTSGADAAHDPQGSQALQREQDIGSGTDTAVHRRARPRTWPWMAIAAALMAIGVVSYLLRPAPDHKDELLGGGSLRAEAPARLADGNLQLKWAGTLPAGSRPFAEVEGRDGESAPWVLVWPAPIAEQVNNPALRDAPLPAGAWIVPHEIASRWPREIRWRVLPRDAARQSTDGSAWSPVFSSH